MGVTATKSLDWIMVRIDPLEEYSVLRQDENGGFLQRRRHFSIERTRRHIGVTAFNEEVGSWSATFQLATGPESSINYSGSAAKSFVCTKDDLSVVDVKSGECIQRQVWEYFSAWETIDYTEFENRSPGGGPGGP